VHQDAHGRVIPRRAASSSMRGRRHALVCRRATEGGDSGVHPVLGRPGPRRMNALCPGQSRGYDSASHLNELMPFTRRGARGWSLGGQVVRRARVADATPVLSLRTAAFADRTQFRSLGRRIALRGWWPARVAAAAMDRGRRGLCDCGRDGGVVWLAPRFGGGLWVARWSGFARSRRVGRRHRHRRRTMRRRGPCPRLPQQGPGMAPIRAVPKRR
jgi:hypothetical protein